MCDAGGVGCAGLSGPLVVRRQKENSHVTPPIAQRTRNYNVTNVFVFLVSFLTFYAHNVSHTKFALIQTTVVLIVSPFSPSTLHLLYLFTKRRSLSVELYFLYNPL